MRARVPGEPRASWTLVLIASAFLFLAHAIGLVTPRSRAPADATSANRVSPEHEPPPSPLVSPRPAPPEATPSGDATPGREAARKAADAAPGWRSAGPASMNHAPDLAVLEIRVTSAGRAVAGASIELVHDALGEATAAAALHATGADGLLRLELAPGTVRAAAWSADACALPASAKLEVGTLARLELALEPAFPVAGRVIDADTGAPVAGAEVALWTFAERDTVVTGADGSFLHPRFPARAPAQQIVAHAAGYGVAVRYLRIDANGAWKISARTAEEESVRGTGTPWVELELVRELRVSGRVMDERGVPIAGARVSAEGFFHALASVATRDRREGTSDADGRFELFGLRSDIGHSLLAEAPGRAAELRELAAGLERVDAGELVLARETVLAGAVIDPAGLPLSGVEVVLRSASAELPPAEHGALDVAARIQGRERRVRTTSEGTFVFEHLVSGPVTLTVEDARGARTEMELLPRADGGFESPCVTLWPASPTVAERLP